VEAQEKIEKVRCDSVFSAIQNFEKTFTTEDTEDTEAALRQHRGKRRIF
jgi:hypothetical protein